MPEGDDIGAAFGWRFIGPPRGGDRSANNALWRIVMTRLNCDERTKEYVARRTQEGHSKREIIRYLKRYVAREVYRALVAPTALAPAA